MSPTGDSTLFKGSGAGRVIGLRESNQALAELKTKLEFALSRLNDQDTQRTSVEEIREFLQTLYADWFPMVINCIGEAAANLKPLGRCESIKLLGLLAELHGELVVPQLPRILQVVVARLQDADLHLREACAETVFRLTRALVLDVESSPIFATLLKPLFGALGEHSKWVQIGAAACICSVIQGSPAAVNRENLGRLCSRLVQHLSLPLAMAKPQLLSACIYAMQSVGADFDEVLPGLMPCLDSCLNATSDWQTRRQAIEVLQMIGDEPELGVSLELPPPANLASVVPGGAPKPTPLQRHIGLLLEVVRTDKVRAVRESVKDVNARWGITRSGVGSGLPIAANRDREEPRRASSPTGGAGGEASGRNDRPRASSPTGGGSPKGSGTVSDPSEGPARRGLGAGGGNVSTSENRGDAGSPSPPRRLGETAASGRLGIQAGIEPSGYGIDSFEGVLVPDKPRTKTGGLADERDEVAAEKAARGAAVKAVLSNAALDKTKKPKITKARSSIFSGPVNNSFFQQRSSAPASSGGDAERGEDIPEGEEDDLDQELLAEQEAYEAAAAGEQAGEEQEDGGDPQLEDPQQMTLEQGTDWLDADPGAGPPESTLLRGMEPASREEQCAPPALQIQQEALRQGGPGREHRPPIVAGLNVAHVHANNVQVPDALGSRKDGGESPVSVATGNSLEPLVYSDDDEIPSPLTRSHRDHRPSSPFQLDDAERLAETASPRHLAKGVAGQAGAGERERRLPAHAATKASEEAAPGGGLWEEDGVASKTESARSSRPEAEKSNDEDWKWDEQPRSRQKVPGGSGGAQSAAALQQILLQLQELQDRAQIAEDDKRETEGQLIGRVRSMERTIEGQNELITKQQQQLQAQERRVAMMEQQFQLQDQQAQQLDQQLQQCDQGQQQIEQQLQEHLLQFEQQDGQLQQHDQVLEQLEQQMEKQRLLIADIVKNKQTALRPGLFGRSQQVTGSSTMEALTPGDDQDPSRTSADERTAPTLEPQDRAAEPLRESSANSLSANEDVAGASGIAASMALLSQQGMLPVPTAAEGRKATAETLKVPPGAPRKAEMLWAKVLQLCEGERFLEAYKQVIAEPEEACLLKLMQHTGPIVERLDAESNSRLIRRLIHILSSPSKEPTAGPCIEQIFSWLKEALDVGIHFTSSQVEDLAATLQRLVQPHSTLPAPERAEAARLLSRLAALRRP